MLQFCSLLMLCNKAIEAQSLCHATLRLWTDTFLLLCSNKTKLKISFHQDAGSFSSNMFIIMFQCRGGGWSCVMIHGHLFGCRLCFSACEGHFFKAHHPQTESEWVILCVRLTVSMCMLTESVQLCTCISG